MDMKWSDDDLFALGKQIEIQMGPVGKLDTLITGRLTPLWLAANTGAAFGVWMLAIYTEIRAMKIPRKEHS